MAHAQQELTRLGVRLGEENPTESRGRAWELVPLHDTLVGSVRTALWILLGAVGIVLLVACSNFANLLLARSASRSHEIAIRSSLGANRSRLVRQFLTESVVLALLGGALGTLLASWGVDLLLALQPNVLPRLGDIRVDAVVLGFAIAVAILTGLAFGAIPALHVTRAMPADTLQRAGSTTLGGREHKVLDAMVVAQVALAIVLLVGAGLLMHGLWKLYSVPPGFDPANVLTMRLELPEARYDSVLTQNQYRDAVFGALRAVPGIQAGMVSELPLAGEALTHNFIIEGRAPIPRGEEPELMSRSVAGDYFQVMRIPVLQGRGLTAADRRGAPLVGVINESMVRTYFPDGHAIGQHVRWAHADPPQWIEIVGVVPDIRHFGLSEPEQPAIYTPYAQFQDNWKRWMCVVVSGPGVTTSGMAERVKDRIWTVDAQIPITQLKPMTDVIAASLADRRFNLTLIGIFAAVALVLASLGIASVASYVTARRTREIGLRLALGADRGDVMALVLGRSLRQVALGTALGVAGALMLTGLMRSMLYQVSAHDPVTYVAVAAALGLAALVASLVPALRATRVDPVITLRSE
jgi:putative ABC transport system permease protein